jgi:endonuclease/exonuclease/phosphatase family metal-dependent hydrolase
MVVTSNGQLLQDGRSAPYGLEGPSDVFDIATYNVHRWTGIAGGRRWCPELALSVIAELDADVIALQEVLRPNLADDPLQRIAEELDLYFAFVPTRQHRLGVLGNAILSRWPMKAVFPVDLSFSRLEQRSAIVSQFQGESHTLTVIATHLALVDRTRKFQVQSLLNHPWLRHPAVLLGDMNAWRRCHATRELDRTLSSHHSNRVWPASYPSAAPVLALDRIYTRGAHLADIQVHNSPAARRGSDHLPVIARIALESRKEEFQA